MKELTNEVIAPNRKQRRASRARRKLRALEKKPDLPWYLVKAIISGNQDVLAKALGRAQRQGYEFEYIAKKIGISQSEFNKAMAAENET